jgi:RNA polymerase sigma-70 factor (ECF subfamily)
MQSTQSLLDLRRLEVPELVLLARDGNREAFGELVTRYEAVTYAIAMRRLRDHAEAQELCQEVFVKAMEKLHQLDAPEAFGSWLRSITVRMAINRAMRRAPTVATAPEAMEATCVEQETPLSSALTAERRHQLHAGLERLGRLDRETLTAFYFSGHSLIEMSEEFSSPVGTIKRRLHVARKRLAKQLEVLAV